MDVALAALESEGFVLRGRFTPGVAEREWCERRLLARIHRYTLGRLRSEIEPVSQTDYVRFLLRWQRVSADTKMRGPESVAAVLAQLEGFEVPAHAWESEILPSRIADYSSAWLDALCLSGRFTWFRRSLAARAGRASGPVRNSPVALVARANAVAWHGAASAEALDFGPAAARVRAELERRGATFFDDLVTGTRLIRTEVEQGLGELVTHGRVTSDAFAGLRSLVTPAAERARGPSRRRGARPVFGMGGAGRWSLLDTAKRVDVDAADLECVARALLRRYGVVFRKILERETELPPFRDLLRVYRRLEASGELRGGRFVAGFSGEQYALPEAVEALRAARRDQASGALVAVCAADPLNVVGVVTPGERIPAIASNRVLYRDGLPVARKIGARVEFLNGAEPPERWALETALVRRPTPEREHDRERAVTT